LRSAAEYLLSFDAKPEHCMVKHFTKAQCAITVSLSHFALRPVTSMNCLSGFLTMGKALAHLKLWCRRSYGMLLSFSLSGHSVSSAQHNSGAQIYRTCSALSKPFSVSYVTVGFQTPGCPSPDVLATILVHYVDMCTHRRKLQLRLAVPNSLF